MINWGESINPSNTVLKWLPMDTEERYKKHLSQADTREMLEQMSRKALLEADKDEAEFLQEKLSKVPYPIYIG